MNSMKRLIIFSLLLLAHSSLSWACTTPATEVMQRQTIGPEYILTKYGHYCQTGNRFATDTLAEAISLDWAEYSFALTMAGTKLDLTALVGSQRRLNKFAMIEAVALPTDAVNIIALQFIAKGSSNIYSEIHIAQVIDSNLQPLASIIEPITHYQAYNRDGSEYLASGFYQLDNGQWAIDSIAASEEIAECNACQKYDVISWTWEANQLQEYFRRPYDIETYKSLSK